MNKYLIKKGENGAKSDANKSLPQPSNDDAELPEYADDLNNENSQIQKENDAKNHQYQTRNICLTNPNNTIAKYQCNKCPCKYKRSNDLSKHLKLKHSINPLNLNDYLTNVQPSKQPDEPGVVDDEPNETYEDYYNDDLDENNQNNADSFSYNNQSHNDSHNSKNSQSKNLANRNFNQVQRRNINQVSKQVQPVEKPTTAKSSSYECPYCTYYSNGNDAEYLYHVKDHLCGKAFRCVLCNSVYKYRGDCVVHLKRKHQKADMIAHSYVDKFNLDSLEIVQICSLLKPKQNEEFENEEKLFGCAYCDYKANYKGDVFKHQTRRHPGTAKSVNALSSNLNTSYTNLNGSEAHSSENNSVNNSFNNNGTNKAGNQTGAAKFNDYENEDEINQDGYDENRLGYLKIKNYLELIILFSLLLKPIVIENFVQFKFNDFIFWFLC